MSRSGFQQGGLKERKGSPLVSSGSGFYVPRMGPEWALVWKLCSTGVSNGENTLVRSIQVLLKNLESWFSTEHAQSHCFGEHKSCQSLNSVSNMSKLSPLCSSLIQDSLESSSGVFTVTIVRSVMNCSPGLTGVRSHGHGCETPVSQELLSQKIDLWQRMNHCSWDCAFPINNWNNIELQPMA